MPRPEYDIHLDEAEANLVLQGLGELPTKLGYNLVTRVAQIVATTNQAWQNQQDQPQKPAGLMGTPPAALMPGLLQEAADAAAAHAGGEPQAGLQALHPDVIHGTPIVPPQDNP
jgi:hypothetical protein